MTKTDSLKEFWFRSTKQIFRDLNKHVLDKGSRHKHRIFINRGSNILLMAHLDTVQKPKWDRLEGDTLYAAGLDDRLGCYLAYRVAENLGLDLLLTDHEECGKTTGAFHTLKDYNWIAEFDRGGADVVTYDLDSPEFIDALDDFWGVGQGTYSDIASLDTTACCVNVGIGYQLDHSADSYADLSETANQMQRFQQFYNKYKDSKFTQVESEPIDWMEDEIPSRKNSRRFWDECDICGGGGVKPIFGYLLCRDCVEYMVESCRIDNELAGIDHRER